MFHLISNELDRYQKVVEIKDINFCVKSLKMKRKKDKNFFDLLGRGFEPQIFSNFLADDLNFNGK